MGTLTNNSPSDDLRAYNISISLWDIYMSIICQLTTSMDDFCVCATYIVAVCIVLKMWCATVQVVFLSIDVFVVLIIQILSTFLL